MGLDITITRRKKLICPKCGEVVGHNDIQSVDSGGRGWYPVLESLGYYLPYERRLEADDWYGKDMTLTVEQIDELFRFVKNEELYNKAEAMNLIATAAYEHEDVVINADW